MKGDDKLMKALPIFAKCLVAMMAILPFCLLGGCGGGGGSHGPRDVLIQIDWLGEDDLDLSAARQDRKFDDFDNISVFNFVGGPPAWGLHHGDVMGGGNCQEQITFSTVEADEPYNAYVNAYKVATQVDVRCRVFFDGSQNPALDSTFTLSQDQTVHFAIITRDGAFPPKGNVLTKVERRQKSRQS